MAILSNNEVDRKKEKLDSSRPINPSVLRKIKEDMDLRWTYNSNAIEGNTLTLNETKVVLEGITVGGKKFIEHLEVINHKFAIDYVEYLVKDSKILSESDIKNIQRLILRGVDDDYAGRYRDKKVLISGASHTPPEHFILKTEMESMLFKYNNLEFPIYNKIAFLHGEFVRIHPFIDGNGRTARLLVNLELMKVGYPPILIKISDRQEYYSLLDECCLIRNYDKFGDFIKTRM
ncbi:MAG: Fic family protein, partial [Alkaliphilus sp.]